MKTGDDRDRTLHIHEECGDRRQDGSRAKTGHRADHFGNECAEKKQREVDRHHAGTTHPAASYLYLSLKADHALWTNYRAMRRVRR